MMWSSKRKASAFSRWKTLRPMIEPNPPPSRIARNSSRRASSSSFLGPTGEDHHPASIEGTLHHVAHPISQRVPWNLFRFVDFSGRFQLQVGRGELDLDKMRAQLGSDVGSIGSYV